MHIFLYPKVVLNPQLLMSVKFWKRTRKQYTHNECNESRRRENYLKIRFNGYLKYFLEIENPKDGVYHSHWNTILTNNKRNSLFYSHFSSLPLNIKQMISYNCTRVFSLMNYLSQSVEHTGIFFGEGINVHNGLKGVAWLTKIAKFLIIFCIFFEYLAKVWRKTIGKSVSI